MEIIEHVSLDQYTTLQVGGPARYFCTVKTDEELRTARQFAEQTAAPLLVIGSGSNVLISDDGFDGLVVHNQILGRTYSEPEDGTVIATFGAGEIWDDVVAETVDKGLWGLENLSHIPGTVGATPVQNVGAYGVEVSSHIVTITAINLQTGEQKDFSNEGCDFGYRESFFKTTVGREWCIIAVSYRLSVEPSPVLSYKDLAHVHNETNLTQANIRQAVIAIRQAKFPDWTSVGTAGSFFKNPIVENSLATQLQQSFPDLPLYPVSASSTKVSLGYILDKICGLKGFSKGPVRLFEQQAMVLVAEQSTAADIQSFAATVAQIVHDKTGITIEQEVTTV